MKKAIIRSGFYSTLLAFVVLATACGTSGSDSKTVGAKVGNSSIASKQPVTIRMAILTAAGGSIEFRVAKDKGIFQKYGVVPETSNYAYGIDTINAMLTKQADTGIAADYALLNSIYKGDLSIVSTLSRTTEKTAKGTILFVRDNIHSPSDLAGKNLGVQKGTVYEYVWSKYLEKQNIDEKKINYIQFSTPDEAIIALQKGQMDAVWIDSSLAGKFASLKGIKAFSDVSAAGVSIEGYVVADKTFVKQNPQAVGNFLKALNEAIQYIHSHKDEAADIAFKELKLPKENVLKYLDSYNATIGFTQDDFDHLQSMKTFLEQKGTLKAQFNLKDKIDIEPLMKALPDTVSYNN